MKNLIDQFLARGLKFSDLFILAGGVILLTFIASWCIWLIDQRSEEESEQEFDWWDDSPWQ